ncbi:MAG: glycosyltransferase, partial [Candidatus Aenigmarchaeota archaeon]|nr:glycosyltransferase [Candidatus Aenigmarchaeota archaeon]
MKISVIIPVKDEQDNVLELYNQLNPVLSKIGKHEIIFIDDGSTDKTANKIKEIKDKSVRLVQFQRNFGKAAALSCGFKEAKGDIIVTMDGDLQDDPKE